MSRPIDIIRRWWLIQSTEHPGAFYDGIGCDFVPLSSLTDFWTNGERAQEQAAKLTKHGQPCEAVEVLVSVRRADCLAAQSQ